TGNGGQFSATLLPGRYEVQVNYRLPRIQLGDTPQDVSFLRSAGAGSIGGSVVIARQQVTLSMDDWRSDLDLAIQPRVTGTDNPVREQDGGVRTSGARTASARR